MKIFGFFLVMIIGLNFAHAIPQSGCGVKTGNGYIVQNFNCADEISAISYKEALKIFEDLKDPKFQIPYMNARTNCQYRAHRISEILAGRGLQTIKVYIEMANNSVGAGAPQFTRDEYVEGERVGLVGIDIAGNEWR